MTDVDLDPKFCDTSSFILWRSSAPREEWQGTTKGNLIEAEQQLANISEQAGPTSGSVFTNNKSCEQLTPMFGKESASPI